MIDASLVHRRRRFLSYLLKPCLTKVVLLNKDMKELTDERYKTYKYYRVIACMFFSNEMTGYPLESDMVYTKLGMIAFSVAV